MVYATNFTGDNALPVVLRRPKASQHSSLIHLVTEMGQGVQLSIHHQPSPFIAQNLERVWSDWVLPVRTCRVILVLQQARYSLADTAPHVEREKDRLREKFMNFGLDVVRNLRDRGFLTDMIDPRTGYPQFSRPGEIAHDDTAVVKALLGFPVMHKICSILEHPNWGSAVYPGVLMSSASPQIIKPILKRVAVQLSWTFSQPNTDLQLSL